MSIREAIAAAYAMLADGVIESYAVGGAVGAAFYLEPATTLDVDIFVSFQPEPGRLPVSPQPLFGYLAARGCPMQGEYVLVGGWPVQFLPPTGPLAEEALREAVTMDVDGTPARVFSAEHLAAVALQTGHTKDKARLLQFIEADALDMARFQEMVQRHGLDAAWRRSQHQFAADPP